MTWKRNTQGLKSWRPGTSGNPRGRPREIGPLIELMPRKELADLVSVLFRGSVSDLQTIARTGTRHSPIQILIARALLGDIKRMEIKNLNWLLNHVIGKPK